MTKGELATRMILDETLMEMPGTAGAAPEPGPVTQIAASITTTAATVRSHMLSAVALGLLIAVVAVWGLGRSTPAVSQSRELSSRSPAAR